MRDKLRTLLGIESGEESVSMLLTQSIFLGIFIGAFDITAYSLLLSTFDEKLMARGYIVSGLAGIIFFSIYSQLRKKHSVSQLAVINQIFMTAAMLILWSALNFSNAKWIIFIVFIMLAPLNILTFLNFWSFTDIRFSGKSKNLFRSAESGLILGIMFISFLIPLLISFKLHSHNILIISFASVFVAMIIQFRLSNQFKPVTKDFEEYNVNALKRLPLFTRKDPFIRILGTFAALSILSTFLIQYIFMAAVRKHFPASEDMAGFLGLFTGWMMIFSLFVKFAAYPFILKHFGMRICLIISPVLIGAITGLAVLFGFSSDIISEAAGGFMIFILILGFNRIISKSLKDSVEIPSLRIVFKPLGDKLKPEIQSGLDGTANEMGLILSGVILTIFGFFNFIKLVHFSILLFVISVIWLFVAFRLFRDYRNSIIESVEKGKGSDSHPDELKRQNILRNRFAGKLLFKSNYFNLITGNYGDMNTITNRWYFEMIVEYARSNKDFNLLPALKKATIHPGLTKEMRQQSGEVAEILQQNNYKSAGETGPEGVKILSGSRLPQTTEILKLLRNNSVESKRLAIFLVGKFHLADLLSLVCECLNVPSLSSDAYEVLKSFGPVAEDELMRYYLITSGNTRTSKIILTLLGKICSKESAGFLFSRLWSNSRQLKETIAGCLIHCKFNPGREEQRRLDQLISDIAGLITWNLSARIILEKDNDNFLLDNINHEIERCEEFLFNILSVTYGSGTFSLIKDHFNENTVESISYGLEMIDLVVSDSIKPKLISLFNPVSDKEKVKNLSRFFPVEISGRTKLLEDLLNRDYNQISLWTKACTLRSIIDIEGKEIAETVIALLFSPEEIIREESANLIRRTNKELYDSPSHRLSESVRKTLDNIINGRIGKNELLFEKVQFLSKCFGINPGDELLALAGELKYMKNFSKNGLKSDEGCIIWHFFDDKMVEVRVLSDGEADIFASIRNHSFYILSLSAVEEYQFQNPGTSIEILKYIDDLENHSSSGDNSL